MSGSRANLASCSDVALLRRVAKGDESAVETLYRTYGDAVLRFVYRRVDGRLEDAEEVMLDTFMTAFQLAPTYRGDSSVLAWLCAIAKLRIVDWLRAQGRLKRIPSDQVVRIEETIVEPLAVDPAPLSDSVLDRFEARRFVDNFITRLSNDEREALLLRHVAELSVRDVASVLKRSEKSIEGLLVRAKQKVKGDQSASFVTAQRRFGLPTERDDTLAGEEAYFSKETSLDPTTPNVLCSLGMALEARMRLREAEATFREACSWDSSAAYPYLRLGAFLKRRARYQEAAVALREAYRLDRRYFAWLGDFLHEQGRTAEAKHLFMEAVPLMREALRKHPKSAPYSTGLAWTLIRTEEALDEALDLAHKAVELDRRDANHVANVGWANFKLGEYGIAEEYLHRACQDPLWGQTQFSGETWWLLGAAFEKNGKAEEAIEAYQTAIRRNSNLKIAEESLRRLSG